MGLFQRVGEEDVQTLSVGHHDTGFRTGDFEGQLQVAYRIGRHQQLEAEQPRQQMVPHIVGPGASESLALNSRSDRCDHLTEESTACPLPGRGMSTRGLSSCLSPGGMSVLIFPVSARPSARLKRSRSRRSTLRTM